MIHGGGGGGVTGVPREPQHMSEIFLGRYVKYGGSAELNEIEKKGLIELFTLTVHAIKQSLLEYPSDIEKGKIEGVRGALVLYTYEVGGAGGTIIDGRGGPSLLTVGLYSTAYFCAPFPPSPFSSRVAGRILT